MGNATEVEMERGHKPSLGGPSKVTLAGMVVKYAHQFTNSKKGAKSELDRINRYLIAANLQQLRQEPTDNGGFKLVEIAKCSDDAMLPSALETILALLDEPFHVAGLELHISCSIGVALYPDCGDDADSLVACVGSANF